MAQPFQILALPVEPFTALFNQEEADLAKLGVRRLVADSKPGFPCRVSLADAEPGETVLLLTYQHQSESPYRGDGPIYVRERASGAMPATGEVPESIRRRLLSVRAYDARHWMVGADVCEGNELETVIDRFFADTEVAYLHLHNARPGCYACRVERAAEI
jgi:hypothetical protein